ELHVAVAAHLAHARTDQAAEDQEVQRHGDGRRHQGLAPDAQDARNLATYHGGQRDAVALAVGQDRRAHADVSWLPVRRTNSSSRRLLLVRIERTRMPAALRAANTRLRSMARGMSMSRVWTSVAVIVVPSITGSWAGSSPSMSSRNPSTSSFASSERIGPCSTIRPWLMIARCRHR